MEITCPACAARYKTDEQKLRGGTARMRCKACDTVWIASAPETTSEERRAAVVRRGAEREHRDLFASRPVDFGSVKQTLRPPPPEASGVAARNETSVLFTVDALKGAARVKTPHPEPSPLSTNMSNPQEDSGIIDLNALASVPPKPGDRPVAPLFSEPPPAAFAREVASSGTGEAVMASGGLGFGKRAIAGIAAAAVAVVLAGVGVAVAFRGEEPTVRTNAVMAPVAAPPPVVAAPAPKPAEPPPPVVASASSDDDAKAPTVGVKGGKGKGKGKGKGGKAASAAGSSKLTKVSSSGVSSEPASKPAASAPDKCGCKGDFNCILRCAAKGK